MKIEEFLSHAVPLLDVRSPAEFLQGHIPGAHSFPLFSDLERAEVGTLYKKAGKDAAVKLGLHMVGPKLASFVEQAETLCCSKRAFQLYCWRGGMRSHSLAWLLQTAGFSCHVLTGGYKAFRHWTLDQFQKPYRLMVLGGLTGSGKTDLLHKLRQQNEQVIDLEALAQHRGSSFVHLGCPPQPSSEHFENTLAWQLSQLDLRLPIWIEDESRQIGTCHLPLALWTQMSGAVFMWIHSPIEDRVKRLLGSYGEYAPQAIIASVERLVRKLGAVRTQQVVHAIQNRAMESAVAMVLEYYDQTYTFACQRRKRPRLECHHTGTDLALVDILKKHSLSPPNEGGAK